MGDKAAAREAMLATGLPVMPGSETTLTNVDEAREIAREIGYPVLLKAAAGGGGRGMRVVPEESRTSTRVRDRTGRGRGSIR